MAKAHINLTALQQFMEMRMILGIKLYRNLACLHRAVGAVRWKSSYRPAPLLTASPARALMDEQISISGRFLPPHQPVTVCARMHSEDGDLWESFSHYNTNANGCVNLSTDPSVGGSYVGCEPMGLFWGLQPAPGGRDGVRLRKKSTEAPYVVHISLLEDHVSPSETLKDNGQSGELAASTVERFYMAPGVKRVEIRQNGVVGTLFLPPGPGPFPAMLDLWGMGGGLYEYRSALFASRGFASLSLAFLGHKDLPGPLNRINVGDKYFKSAFHLLQDHPQICADRIGIIGLSFGVYLALRIATQSSVKPNCLICINGPVGSTAKLSDADGRTEAFESDQALWTYDDQGYVTFRKLSAPANIPPQNKVKLENISCPLMYIVGEDDVNCSSDQNANQIEEALSAVGKAQLFTRLSYPGAGHLIEPPYSPNVRTSLWAVKPKKLFTQWGGHPALHAAAQEDAWKKMLDFMDTNLRG
ncbi:bile acid-CoA:amino acid N-acyltransferase-like [Myripristis murdjan]|uniref:bile acid-CoA:amino acid N-acyltransferase-like n=1 Tax=Myripristis murdjan TaxID=586833 RepID=UPI001175FF6A|nr:bile acid-CoA:amino acid N-acyltransferase-like [Myripristis murdjan]XP_029906761.1 bile acid-CoA:amino acid N-acyltransferase-like [Myripristis murdjan]